MLNQRDATTRATDRAESSAPSLLLAYGIYLIIAAVVVSAGGRVPPIVVWFVVCAIVVATSRHITAAWSLYNGVAAALFFASFASKPFGDVHVHGALGWVAFIGLIVISFVSSGLRIASGSTIAIEARRRMTEPLPWMHSIPPIDPADLWDARATLIKKSREDPWLM